MDITDTTTVKECISLLNDVDCSDKDEVAHVVDDVVDDVADKLQVLLNRIALHIARNLTTEEEAG